MMDTITSLANAAASGLIAMALLGAVLSPRVHDGVVIKVGLICMAAGFGAVALQMTDGPNTTGLQRAILMINAGIAVVVIGYLWRVGFAHHRLRRTTDWVDFESRSPSP